MTETTIAPRPCATAWTPRRCSRRWTRSRPSPRSPSSASGPRNRWLGGAHNRSTIKDFYAACGEDTSRTEAFTLDAGEPAILLGTDTGPNPAEYLLHALAACVTTSLVFSAAARGVRLTSVESTLEGDLDVQGAMGTNTVDYRNGFEQIRMTITISGDAPAEKLRQVVQRGTDRSVVFDSISHGVPISVDVVTA